MRWIKNVASGAPWQVTDEEANRLLARRNDLDAPEFVEIGESEAREKPDPENDPTDGQSGAVVHSGFVAGTGGAAGHAIDPALIPAPPESPEAGVPGGLGVISTERPAQTGTAAEPDATDKALLLDPRVEGPTPTPAPSGDVEPKTETTGDDGKPESKAPAKSTPAKSGTTKTGSSQS